MGVKKYKRVGKRKVKRIRKAARALVGKVAKEEDKAKDVKDRRDLDPPQEAVPSLSLPHVATPVSEENKELDATVHGTDAPQAVPSHQNSQSDSQQNSEPILHEWMEEAYKRRGGWYKKTETPPLKVFTRTKKKPTVGEVTQEWSKQLPAV